MNKTRKQGKWKIPGSAVKIHLPNKFQTKDYTCGGVAMQSILSYYGAGNFTEKEMERELNMTNIGTDPWQFKLVLKKYGLNYKEYHAMTQQQLKYIIDMGKPVIVTVQAWSNRSLETYRDVWNEGHWITAIGYDGKGFYFEDPTHKDVRGFIEYDEFEDRWHDIGDNEFPEDHYALVIWGEKVVNKDLKTKYAASTP